MYREEVDARCDIQRRTGCLKQKNSPPSEAEPPPAADSGASVAEPGVGAGETVRASA